MFEGGSSDKWGFIDRKGNFVHEPQFDRVPLPGDKLWLISKDDKFGYMDIKGSIVIKPQFENANIFSQGAASVTKNGKYGYIKNPFYFKRNY
jgi:hypothetical protein